MKVYVGGGNGDSGVKTLTGFDDFIKFISEGGHFLQRHLVNLYFVALRICRIIHLIKLNLKLILIAILYMQELNIGI